MSSEAKAIIYAGGGGVAVLSLATLGMIAWLFLSAMPRPRPARDVAQDDDQPADSAEVENGDKPDPQPPARADVDAPEPDAETPEPDDAQAADEALAPFIRFTLEEEVTASAFDPVGGQLALAGPWPGAVGIVTAEQLSGGGNTDDVELVQLTGTPALVEYKPLPDGGLFLVGQREPDALVLIDPETRQFQRMFPLETGAPLNLAASANPDVQEAWVATAQRTQKLLTRCDLQQEAIAETIEVKYLRDFTASHDGSVLYCRATGQRGGRGPIRPDALEDSDWNKYPTLQGRDQRYIDALGRFVVSGRQVFSPDFQVRLPDLQFEAEAFLPDRPWAAGIEDSEFVVGSINDGRIVSRFPLPLEWHRVQQPADRNEARENNLDMWSELLGGRVFADTTRDRFILTTPHRILSFPLDELDLPEEPMLLLADDPPDSAVVSDPLEFPLTTISGEPSAELIDAPEGATVEENTLRWTPQLEQFGPQELAVRFTDGDVSHETRWIVDVRQKTLPVAFEVRGCDPSLDGTRLVAWGHDWTPASASRRTVENDVADNWRLAVINLEDLQIVAEKEVDHPIHQVEFCGPEVVMADTIDGLVTLKRLSADDLSEVGRAEVPGGTMTSIADRLLAVVSPGQSAEDQLKLYSLPDLEPRDPDHAEAVAGTELFREVFREDYLIVHGARQLADGWLLDGALWDDELREPLLLIDPQGFLRVPIQNLPLPTIGATRVLSGSVCDIVGPVQRRGGARDDSESDMRNSPHITATFVYGFRDETVFLDLNEFDSVEPSRSIPLRSWPTVRGQGSQITTSPDDIFVTLYGETFVIPIPEWPVPFRIEPRQSELELSGRRPTRVTYEAKGATRFELEIPALGTSDAPLRLESNDGTFRIGPVNLDQLATAVWPTVPRRRPEDTQDRIRQATLAWERFIGGRAPAGVPVRIDAFVRATNRDGDVAVLKHAWLVMIPSPIFARNEP